MELLVKFNNWISKPAVQYVLDYVQALSETFIAAGMVGRMNATVEVVATTDNVIRLGAVIVMSLFLISERNWGWPEKIEAVLLPGGFLVASVLASFIAPWLYAPTITLTFAGLAISNWIQIYQYEKSSSTSGYVYRLVQAIKAINLKKSWNSLKTRLEKSKTSKPPKPGSASLANQNRPIQDDDDDEDGDKDKN